MDWIAVFAAAGGAATFAGAARFVAEKAVEQAIAGRRSAKVERAKVAYAANAEHQALIARTQLDVLGAILDAIYPLKTTLARLEIDAPRLSWSGVDGIVDRMDATIKGLEANLGAKRPYIPAPFDGHVHSFKNDLYHLRVDFVTTLHSLRGQRHLTEDQSAKVRQRLIGLMADVEVLFGGLIGEAQRRVAGDAP